MTALLTLALITIATAGCLILGFFRFLAVMGREAVRNVSAWPLIAAAGVAVVLHFIMIGSGL